MKYKCLIIDDEELARDLIENHLSQLDDFELIASCSSAIEASKLIQNHSIDLLFLDIQMPVLKGTDFFKNLINKPNVIFTTAYRDYAFEGFELNAVDYLLKPITFSRFFKAIEKFRALDMKPQPTTIANPDIKRKDDYIFVREERKQVKIFFDDILYIESVKDYIKIITTNKNHITKFALSAFEQSLDERFIRTHRSYLVNSEKITAYTKHDVEINGFEIPISDGYKKNTLQVLEGGEPT